jgi:hypothetical protein
MADDASPQSFHDANQSVLLVLSPEPTPSPAPGGAVPTNTYFSDSTPLPLQQRQLFENNPSDGGTPRYLCWMALGGQASLNMNDVVEEAGKHGDGDSVGEANKAAELEESLDETLRDRLLILIKNKGSEEEVLDTEQNHVLLKKGLAAEISMPSVPPDWIPPNPKVSKGEPKLFDSVDNPGGWEEFTYRPKFKKKRYTGVHAPCPPYWSNTRAGES